MWLMVESVRQAQEHLRGRVAELAAERDELDQRLGDSRDELREIADSGRERNGDKPFPTRSGRSITSRVRAIPSIH